MLDGLFKIIVKNDCHYPDTSKIHKIVAIGTHEWNNEIIILAIKPLHGKKIYLIGEEGVKKA